MCFSIDFSNNNIFSLRGLDQVYSMQILSLRNNHIKDFSELKFLKRLPLLVDIFLEGNALSQSINYRELVYSQLSTSKISPESLQNLPSLDGNPISPEEIRRIVFPPVAPMAGLPTLADSSAAVSVNSFVHRATNVQIPSDSNHVEEGVVDNVHTRVGEKRAKMQVTISKMIERRRPKVSSPRDNDALPLLPSQVRDAIFSFNQQHPLPIVNHEVSHKVQSRTESVDSICTRDRFDSELIDDILAKIEEKTSGLDGGYVSCRSYGAPRVFGEEESESGDSDWNADIGCTENN